MTGCERAITNMLQNQIVTFVATHMKLVMRVVNPDILTIILCSGLNFYF